MHADRGKPLRRLLAPRAALARIGEEPAQRRLERGGALAAIVAMAAQVVAVLGDVREQREIAERPHHGNGLFGGEGVERLREPLARGDVLQPPARHRELADLLDPREHLLALVGADRVAEEAPEEADVLAYPGVLVHAIVHDGKDTRE